MSFLNVLNGIFQILKGVDTVRGLLGGNAGNYITVADLERVIRGEHARFFTTIAFADLETIHNQFYNTWLPSITRRKEITASDLDSKTQPPLYLVLKDLIRVRTELSVLLNRVREVFRAYQKELHIDELVDGVFASMHGFGLLFHIHGVYAELRRIQIGATTLDDAELLPDTLAALQYIRDAQATLDLFLNDSTIQQSRLDMISSLRRYQGGLVNPPSWSFDDSYRPRASTPANASLYVYVDSYRLPTEKAARERRSQHVVNVKRMMDAVFIKDASGVRRENGRIRSFLMDRNYTQTRMSSSFKSVSSLVSSQIELEKLLAAHDLIDIVPVDAEEFITLSERLREELLTASSQVDGRRVKASL